MEPDVGRQLEVMRRGAVEIHTAEDLERKVRAAVGEERPLRVKLGLDPTAPDIHLGHTVVLGKLRQFQDLGHQAVLIIGDYTGMVGDPSGRSKTRPPLTVEEIEKNLKTYLEQVDAVLDVEKLEIRRNGEWFSKMSFADVLKMAGASTVARMLERDDFAKRYKSGAPIGVHELLYPLMQARDSVEIRADIELGGTDQTFNLLAGRDMQRSLGQEPQVALTTPLLVGLDGTEKMSKSLGNYVGVTESAGEMFGKVMSLADTMMKPYFTLLTDLPGGEIEEVLAGHPREAKERLGREIVTRYHSEAAADDAAAEFRRVFSEKKLPSDMPEVKLPAKTIVIVDLLMLAGHARSRSDARRLIAGGGVSVDGEKIADIHADVSPPDGAVLQTGKRRFARLKPG
ncbi:MAG: tyrosine--tRNA ligase [Planctomycetota bacterium]